MVKLVAFEGKQEIKDIYLNFARTCHIDVYKESQLPGFMDHLPNNLNKTWIPDILVEALNKIFRYLPFTDKAEWPTQIFSAIMPGADLSLVWPRFVLWLLIDPENGLVSLCKQESTTQELVYKTASLYEDLINTGSFHQKLWGEILQACNLQEKVWSLTESIATAPFSKEEAHEVNILRMTAAILRVITDTSKSGSAIVYQALSTCKNTREHAKAMLKLLNEASVINQSNETVEVQLKAAQEEIASLKEAIAESKEWNEMLYKELGISKCPTHNAYCVAHCSAEMVRQFHELQQGSDAW